MLTNNATRNFIGPSRYLYYAFKIAGNINAIPVIEAAGNNPNLESLNLAFTGLNDDIIDTIIQSLIKKEKTKLKELDLSGNHFTDVGINKLLEAIRLAPHSQLEILNLRGNPELTIKPHVEGKLKISLP